MNKQYRRVKKVNENNMTQNWEARYAVIVVHFCIYTIRFKRNRRVLEDIQNLRSERPDLIPLGCQFFRAA